MTLPVTIRTQIFTLILLVLMSTQVVSVFAEAVIGQNGKDQGNLPASDTSLLTSFGVSSDDQQKFAEKAKEITEKNKASTGVQKAGLNVAGEYVENSMEKITTSDGKPFEGGTTINFTITADNKVTGTVDFKFIEQGWTVKIKGTVTGTLTPSTGKLEIHSNDATFKYAGKQYPITMDVKAQYNGSGFDGTKDLVMAGTKGTLGFHANPV
ncbi:MAG TPA: hypothetical protein VN429_07560 [Methanospirillum sp.]|uniref:hypothetical protein n=1 Tax=Methanospirillum sp. TaxID=45200 RepID=UPI002C760932|nr:hypothetical protein [Methanospirillum sp.]HWQ64258.1 hypothetical protein [Methanospirillum sp.]